MQVIAAGAAAAGSTDPQAVAAKIHEGAPITTVIGDLSYNEKGDRKDADYTMYVWKKNAEGKISYEQM
jgi:branched-chain amino acid transport system substrate-binding protein